MTMVRISHVRQYFVIAFSSAPFELWDLKKLCILRTMPKKFPLVTALAWSPLHSSRSKVDNLANFALLTHAHLAKYFTLREESEEWKS